MSAHTCPFRWLRRHLPRVRGRLFCVSHFIIFYFYLYKNYNFFFLSRSLPPNTEGSAEPREAIGVSWRTQVKIVLSCLLTLTPSDGSAATFPVCGDGFFV